MADDPVNVKERMKVFEQKATGGDSQQTGKPKAEQRTTRPKDGDSHQAGKPNADQRTTRPKDGDSHQAGKPKAEQHTTRPKDANPRLVDTPYRGPKQTSSKKYDSKLFKEPVQLVFTDEKTGKLRCNEKTLTLLHEINYPLNVVAITGLYRTGKSYLLNTLAGKRTGFKLGSKVRGCTKGIWIWCRPNPFIDHQVLVLLDVEGFGDTEKVNRKEDTWLFTLATLLSSSLVYNNRGPLDDTALDRLKFLEAIDSTIQVSQNADDKRLLDFDFFFPDFVVSLRDFYLEIVNTENQPVTPDEYLEGLLKQRKGEGKDIEMYNRIRILIRRYFKKRRCFAFVSPCHPKETLEKLSSKDLEPTFLKSVNDFSEYVLNHKPLQLKSGRKINGRMFANLTLHYVNAIGQNQQPSILEATRYMVDVENQSAVATASELYKKEMQKFIEEMGNTNPSDETLVNYHEQCMTRALNYFRHTVVFDDDDIFQQKAMSACRNLQSQFKSKCDENSKKVCKDAIAGLNKRIDQKLKKGAYCCPNGYEGYINDIKWITSKYTSLTGLGAKADSILKTYLRGKLQEEEHVYALALKAQTGARDTQLMQGALQRPSKLDEITKNITISSPFSQKVETKLAKLEDTINLELAKTLKRDKNKIQENYIENVQMKLKELERQMTEVYERGTSMHDLEDQIEYFQKVLASAQDRHECVDGTSEASDRQFDVEPKSNSEQRRKPVKRWCKVQ